MATTIETAAIVYPESDGKPMAENTKQFDYIVLIKGGLDVRFRADPQVFVAGDLFWYPVEGHPEICQAPDILVALGRPRGHRGSYKQWEEDDIAPQVVFEIRSPSETTASMRRKFGFYELYGVREYYVYDPDRGTLQGWQRQGQQLQEITAMDGWVSPLLGVRFTLAQGELQLYYPDGEAFPTLLEQIEHVEQARQQAAQARQQAEQAQQQVAAMAARLRALGIDPDSV